MAGYIYESSGKFYVRFREDGKQRSRYVCDRDDAHRTRTSATVKNKAREIMVEINREAAKPAPAMADMKIADYWTAVFLPHCTEITADDRPRLKPSTVFAWKQIWRQHLAGHFGEKTLRQYAPQDGMLFLRSLTVKLSQQTIRHIAGLSRLIFKLAQEEMRIPRNPWTDVIVPKSDLKKKATPHYTWDEARAVIAALDGQPSAQLIIALCCFMGLRPNEVCALRWEDVDGQWLHIRRGMVRGKLDVPKTSGSVNTVPLPAEMQTRIEEYRAGHGEGWMFPGNGVLKADHIVAPEMRHLAGQAPIDLHNLVARVIKPMLKAAKVPWKPLKAGRTGACTEIIERTGRADLAQRVLRHDDMSTTLRHYKKHLSDAETQRQMRLLSFAELQ